MPERGKAAVFVDRDGTICFDKHYLADPKELELIPTVTQGIRRLNEAGIPVIVITNQSGIARGFFDEKALARIHAKLGEMLASEHARIDDIFYCPHMPDAGCRCRKPRTGMIEDAAKRHGIDLGQSFVIGDRMMDIEMAHMVKAMGILVPEPGDQYRVDNEVSASQDKPDFRRKAFIDAAEIILMVLEDRRARNEKH
jgi:D-glycero-D-manno-heptose 1,7-bisphosphate phosphatase